MTPGIGGCRIALVNVLRNQFDESSKEIAGTILIAQNQIKDGFLVSAQGN